MKFSESSLARLATVDRRLQDVFNEAIKDPPYDFGITEGIRSKERQAFLFKSGKSQTMHSKHLLGRAVDICVFIDGKACWDFDKYNVVAEHILSIAAKLRIAVVWGGYWTTLRDGPHFQLSEVEE